MRWSSVRPTGRRRHAGAVADGSLLFAARCGDHDQADAISFGLRMWWSTDSGETWQQLIAAAKTRASTPVVLSQAGDGTPFIAANPYFEVLHDADGRRVSIWSHRQRLQRWPIGDDRRTLLDPVLIRDTTDFGPPPAGRHWYADHTIANTVQLADGFGTRC